VSEYVSESISYFSHLQKKKKERKMAEEEENREKGFNGTEPMQSTSPRGSRYHWWGDEPINIDEALLDFEEYNFLPSPLLFVLTGTPPDSVELSPKQPANPHVQTPTAAQE